MDVDELADHIGASAGGCQRFIVAIAGPPGAGKSTLAEELYDCLSKKTAKAQIVPMDGFHLDNAILSERGLLDRKGAPVTFDAVGFVELIKQLKRSEGDIHIPVFDRERDMVIADANLVSSEKTILLVEGNYLLLKEMPWEELADIWDETIFINPGIDVLRTRLIDRWLDHGLNPESALQRASSNDIPNAHYVVDNSAPAKIMIKER